MKYQANEVKLAPEPQNTVPVAVLLTSNIVDGLVLPGPTLLFALSQSSYYNA